MKCELFSISGRKVLITGGTAGIGLAVATHFVHEGADVVIVGRRDSGNEIAEKIGALFIQADVSLPEENKKMFKQAQEMLGPLDVLILNAGVTNKDLTVDKLSFKEMRDLFSINFDSVYAGVHYGVPYMAQNSSILITSSPASLTTSATFSAYSPSKAACNLLARCAALELAPLGIRVNCIMPGGVETEMLNASSHDVEPIIAMLTIDHLRQPEELVGCFQFLASDASAPMTGSLLVADDGISAGLSNDVLGKLMG